MSVLFCLLFLCFSVTKYDLLSSGISVFMSQFFIFIWLIKGSHWIGGGGGINQDMFAKEHSK